MTFDNSDNHKCYNIMRIVAFFKCHDFQYI